ncbi:MAG: HIT family protein [Candidatus Izemoplasmatales bacterium]
MGYDMLITWMNEEEKVKYNLQDFKEFEVVVAKQRRLDKVLGYLAFSREKNTIVKTEIFDISKQDQILEKLELVASRQLKPMSGSFHSLYPKFHERSFEQNCPVCNNSPMAEGMDDIGELDHSFVTVDEKAQGKLYGKCVVISKVHNVHFYDLTDEDMVNFMKDVKRTAKALHIVSGAVKINYEIHGNSSPHLHCHLFPRYLDDDFPGKSIEYGLIEPSPYESKEDFDFFFYEMRKILESQE